MVAATQVVSRSAAFFLWENGRMIFLNDLLYLERSTTAITISKIPPNTEIRMIHQSLQRMVPMEKTADRERSPVV